MHCSALPYKKGEGVVAKSDGGREDHSLYEQSSLKLKINTHKKLVPTQAQAQAKLSDGDIYFIGLIRALEDLNILRSNSPRISAEPSHGRLNLSSSSQFMAFASGFFISKSKAKNKTNTPETSSAISDRLSPGFASRLAVGAPREPTPSVNGNTHTIPPKSGISSTLKNISPIQPGPRVRIKKSNGGTAVE